jgi:hypothetical protein
MIQADNKKTEERIIVELFRDAFGDFPKGILNNTESPDFILSLGPRKKIGIELTRLHVHPAGSDPFSFENISACLQQKEEKLSLYRRKKLYEYWLVLASRDPAYKPASNIHNNLLAWKFSSGFTRIFLFCILTGKIYELEKKPPK